MSHAPHPPRSPIGSSEGDYEEDAPTDDVQWQVQSAGKPVQPSATDHFESNSPRIPAVPMQKRRRVTRACDECRRKKIKCDGKQPCTHCTVYSYGRPPSFLSNCFTQARPQIVRMISPRTGDEIRLLNISRLWRSNCNGQKPLSEMSCRTLTWMIHLWIPRYRLTSPPIRSMKIPQTHHQSSQFSGRNTIRSPQQARLRKIPCSNQWWRIRVP